MKNKYLLTLAVIVISCFSGLAVPYETSWYENPAGPHFYEISSSADYDGLVHLINEEGLSFESDTICIKNDLNLEGVESISLFMGYIYGDNVTISNMSNPLINSLRKGGMVEGLSFDSSCRVLSGTDAGMVAQSCQGIIKNCVSHASVSISDYEAFRVGGICGNLKEGGKILGCKNYGKVSGSVYSSKMVTMRAGGICGYVGDNSKVIGCINYGEVTASSYAYAIAGGIVGDNQSSLVENCTNYGNVQSTLTGTSNLTSSQIIQNTGGIAGLSQFGSSVNMCANYGDISNNTQYVAGIVGNSGRASITNCANYGDVTSTENYFFSCATGICSYFSGVSLSEGYVLSNCLNTGKIVSRTKNAIATAAGICNDIKYATIANLLSTGSVSASATGPSSNSFTIPQYEYSDCNVISEISSLEEANSFIDSYDGDLNFVKWNYSDNGEITLANSFSYFIEAYEGYAELFCFSDNDGMTYRISFVSPQHEEVVFEDNTVISGLIPGTQYNYRLSCNNYDYYPVSGSFFTEKVSVTLSQEEVSFTKANFNVGIKARGCLLENVGVKYRKADSSQWIYSVGDKNEVALTGLTDNTVYDIKPVCVIFGKEYEGDYFEFTTPELIPAISKTGETSSSLSFATDNPEDLTGYHYGILIEDEEYFPDAMGNFCVSGLACDKYFDISSFIEKHGERHVYSIGRFGLINFETGDALQISPKAAMVLVRVGNKKMPEYPYYDYSDYKVEVKGINDEEISDKLPAGLTPIYTGNTYEYCITFDCPTDQIYQYRLRVGTTRTYYNKYDYLYGEWKVVNPAKPTVAVVEPLFTNYSSSLKSGIVTVSCSNVPGEEAIVSSGIEYRLADSPNFIPIELTASNGVLSRSFSTLVPGYDYVGRFFSKVEGKTYYSSEFTFNAEGELSYEIPESPGDDNGNHKLTFLYPDNGMISQTVEYDTPINLHFSAPSGWHINSIRFNGVELNSSYEEIAEKDITLPPLTDDSILAFTICQSVQGGMPTINDETDNIKVYSCGNEIHISTNGDLPYTACFDINGIEIFSGYSSSFAVSVPGVYIVKTRNKIYKLYVNF